MAKKLDVKEFLLHKGERLGFGVALVFMILLIGIGSASGLSGDSPSTTAERIHNQADEIQKQVITRPAKVLPPLDPIYTTVGVVGEQVEPAKFATNTENWRNTQAEISKNTNPVILAPVEWDAKLVR